jgi:uncharacterized membrane protein
MYIALVLHVLGVTIWVGGMFFAYMVLRPAAGPLDGPARLSLWQRVFQGFFPWVWASIAAILASGFAMIFVEYGGLAGLPGFVHAMMMLGILMVLIYIYLYSVLWQRFRRAVSLADWKEAASGLSKIRQVVRLNLVLGLITAAIGAGGRFFG